MGTTAITPAAARLGPMVTDIEIAAAQIKDLTEALFEADAALVYALGAKALDHKITQRLLDARICIWQATNQ